MKISISVYHYYTCSWTTFVFFICPSILTFDTEIISRSFFTFCCSNGLFLGSGVGFKNCFGVFHIDLVPTQLLLWLFVVRFVVVVGLWQYYKIISVVKARQHGGPNCLFLLIWFDDHSNAVPTKGKSVPTMLLLSLPGAFPLIFLNEC